MVSEKDDLISTSCSRFDFFYYNLSAYDKSPNSCHDLCRSGRIGYCFALCASLYRTSCLIAMLVVVSRYAVGIPPLLMAVKRFLVLVIILFGFSVAHFALADDFDNFDNFTAGSSILGSTWACKATGSTPCGSIIATTTIRAISYPNTVQSDYTSGVTQGTFYRVSPVASSSEGSLTIAYNASTSSFFGGVGIGLATTTYGLSGKNPGQMPNVFLQSGNIVLSMGNGFGSGATHSMGAYSSGWHTMSIEWRKGASYYEFRGIKSDTTASTTVWFVSSIPNTSVMYATMFLNSFSTSRTHRAFIDNFQAVGSQPSSDATLSNVAKQINTRFLSAGHSSTTVYASFYIDPNEISTSSPVYNINLVRYGFVSRTSGSTSVPYYQSESVYGVTGTSSATTTIPALADGVYDVYIGFANQGTSISGVVPFPFDYIYTWVSISGGYVTAMGSVDNYNQKRVFSSPNTITYQPCSVTQVDGCIENAFIFLFVPQDGSVSFGELGVSNIQAEMAAVYPFNYFFVFSSAITSLSQYGATTFPTYTLNLPFLGVSFPILSQALIDQYYPSSSRLLIRGLLSATLYLATLFSIYMSITYFFERRGAKMSV